MKIILKIIFPFLFLFSLGGLLLFFCPNQALAQGLCEGPLVPCGGKNQPPCELCHFFVMLNNLIRFVMFCLVPPLAILMFVIGGGLFLFGGASPELLNKAKSIITNTVIGLLIVFCAWIIVNTILTGTGIVKMESLLKWWEIQC